MDPKQNQEFNTVYAPTSSNVPLSPSQNVPPKKKHPHTFFSILIGLAIALLISLLYSYSYKLIYSPKQLDLSSYKEQYEKCNEISQEKVYEKNVCLTKGGIWNEYEEGRSFGTIMVDGREVAITGTCSLYEKESECRDQIEKPDMDFRSEEKQGKHVGALIIGIILVALSMFVKKVLAVSIGMALGGIFLLLPSVVYFWKDIPGPLRVLILAVGLAVVIYFATRKMKTDN